LVIVYSSILQDIEFSFSFSQALILPTSICYQIKNEGSRE